MLHVPMLPLVRRSNSQVSCQSALEVARNYHLDEKAVRQEGCLTEIHPKPNPHIHLRVSKRRYREYRRLPVDSPF